MSLSSAEQEKHWLTRWWRENYVPSLKIEPRFPDSLTRSLLQYKLPTENTKNTGSWNNGNIKASAPALWSQEAGSVGCDNNLLLVAGRAVWSYILLVTWFHRLTERCWLMGCASSHRNVASFSQIANREMRYQLANIELLTNCKHHKFNFVEIVFNTTKFTDTQLLVRYVRMISA
jgi:hypothetical protein